MIYDNAKYQGVTLAMESSRGHESEDSQRDFYRQMVEAIRVLKRNDQMLHNLMLMECWSIVRTMDQLNSGFWSRYMKNHQEVSQQRLQQWQAEKQSTQEKKRTASLTRQSSPFESEEEARVVQEKLSERIALFSDMIGEEFFSSDRRPTSDTVEEDREV